MDIIFLEDVTISAWIGWYDWERLNPQLLNLQLEIALPNPKAALSDDLNDTIDYAAVMARIRADLQQQHFLLLEALAEHLAHIVLHDFSAPWVKVRLAKIKIMPDVKRVGICIERRQP